MTDALKDVGAVVERLSKLKVWDDHPSNEELGPMAAALIQSQAAELAEVKRKLAVTDKALAAIAEGKPENPVGDPWAFYEDLVAVARRARETIGARNEQD